MRIYFAASLFTQAERIWNRALAAAIQKHFPAAEIILPQDFDAKGKHDVAAAYKTLFAECVKGIDRADVVLAIIDGADPDSGTSWEMGYAYAKGKPVIGLRTDFRPGAECGVNIMLSRSCRYLVREYAFQEDVAAAARSVVRRLKRLKEELKKHGGEAGD